MKKEERIQRYGEAAYERWLQQIRDWAARNREEHREEENARVMKWREANPEKVRAWREANPEKVLAHNQEHSRKGGKYYEKYSEYLRTGLQGERNTIRKRHRILYRTIKQATPNSVLHHEWIPGTANYRGVALVEKEAHENGIIKVILILEGKITLFTEKEIKEQESVI